MTRAKDKTERKRTPGIGAQAGTGEGKDAAPEGTAPAPKAKPARARGKKASPVRGSRRCRRMSLSSRSDAAPRPCCMHVWVSGASCCRRSWDCFRLSCAWLDARRLIPDCRQGRAYAGSENTDTSSRDAHARAAGAAVGHGPLHYQFINSEWPADVCFGVHFGCKSDIADVRKLRNAGRHPRWL